MAGGSKAANGLPEAMASTHHLDIVNAWRMLMSQVGDDASAHLFIHHEASTA